MDENNHLIQDFEIPEGTLPVRMQTGDSAVTIVGWIATFEDLPQLLEGLAKEFREIMENRENASASSN